MIRDAEIFNDIQRLILYCIKGKISDGNPWARWIVIDRFPDEKVFSHFDNLIMFLGDPKTSSKLGQYGGTKSVLEMSLEIGIWCNDLHGGRSELKRCYGRCFDFFNNPSCNLYAFDVSLGATDYTDTTLAAADLYVYDVTDLVPIPVKEMTEYRGRFDLLIRKK